MFGLTNKNTTTLKPFSQDLVGAVADPPGCPGEKLSLSPSSLSDNSFPGCALLASGHALTEAKLHYNFVNLVSSYKEYRALTFLDTIYARGQPKEVRLCESR